MAKLVLKFPVSTSDVDTLARIERVAGSPAILDAEPSTRAVLFLRSASGRTGFCLASFYVWLGAEASTDEERKNWTHSQVVKHLSLSFSAIRTIALCARSIFDHSTKPGLHAKMVTKLSALDVDKVCKYWVPDDSIKEGDARRGLAFVQKALARCAVGINEAKKSNCILTRRVALMKAFADREGAHISLQHYELDLLDAVHVVATSALWGAVIHHFDKREDGAKWLNEIDQAAYETGTELFPELTRVPRLFKSFDLESSLRNFYKPHFSDGADYLSTYLLSALGWDCLPREFQA
ncbi:MAG TPA: hypothetical protein VEP67_04515 [Thiobacillaceae bacterium]|nr:hypothetical protein [Thiobacillaceae bacterium]